MRITYVITKSGVGGAQVNVLSLVRGMLGRGYAVALVVGETGWLANEAEQAGAEVHVLAGLRRSWSPFKSLKFALRLREFCLKWRPGIVHFHSSNALFGVLGLGFLKERPKCLFTVHGWSFLHPGWRKSRVLQWFYARAMRFLVERCDRVVYVCQADRVFAHERHLVRDGRGTVVHNGIEASRAFLKREAARLELGRRSGRILFDRKVIGTIARLDYQKNIDAMIEVARELGDPHAIFLLIGDGPERARLEEMVRRYALIGRFLFLSNFADAAAVLPGFDIFLMTSRYEGLPYSLLEAGLAGVPIVASDVGGVTEIVEDGVSGWIYKEGDAAGLLAVVRTALADEVVARARGEAARRRVMVKFGEEEMVRRILAIYEDER